MKYLLPGMYAVQFTIILIARRLDYIPTRKYAHPGKVLYMLHVT